jgi:hypothetical protein
MANEYNNTALANSTDVKYELQLLKARYAAAKLMPTVLNKSDRVKESGNTIVIDIEPKYTAGIVTAATGAFTALNTAPTQVNIVVDTWQYVAVKITTQAQAQSYWDPLSRIADNGGAALGEQNDQALGNLYSSVASGNNIGKEGNPEKWSPEMATTGMLKLIEANVPADNLFFWLPPVALLKGWYAQDSLTAAHSTGLNKNLLITGEPTPILGVPVKWSMNLARANSNRTWKGMLVHREAMAIAMQLNAKFERASLLPTGVFGEIGAVQSLYGVKVLRSDHFAVFNIAAIG